MPGIHPTVEIAVRRWVIPTSGSRRHASEHRVEVHHRLAHAHEDRVGDLGGAAEVQRLVEDLPGGEVAAEAHRAGGAERARQRASRLRAEAYRAAPVAVAHQHRLDRQPVVGAEERLDRAVARACLALEHERRERDALCELRAQRRRQVGHLVVAARAARGPLPHLAGAERGLAAFGQRLFEQCRVDQPRLLRQRALHERRGVHAVRERAERAVAPAQARGAERVGDRRGPVADQQRALQRERHVLDQRAGGELRLAAAQVVERGARQRRGARRAAGPPRAPTRTPP